jgi:hypothetical protein
MTQMEKLFAWIEASKDEANFDILSAKDKFMELEEQQIKAAWNDGWKTATFNKCDWSENGYYDKVKSVECRYGFYTCVNMDEMCNDCEEGSNYEGE